MVISTHIFFFFASSGFTYTLYVLEVAVHILLHIHVLSSIGYINETLLFQYFLCLKVRTAYLHLSTGHSAMRDKPDVHRMKTASTPLEIFMESEQGWN
jgi:hypothetical protein